MFHISRVHGSHRVLIPRTRAGRNRLSLARFPQRREPPPRSWASFSSFPFHDAPPFERHARPGIVVAVTAVDSRVLPLSRRLGSRMGDLL